MKKSAVITIILLTLTACGSNNPSGLYQCKGVYKSLEFDNGNVIVDLGFMQAQGTYEINGHNVILSLDGKTLVLKSSDVDEFKIKADDFMALDSPVLRCMNAEIVKKQAN